MNERAKIEKFSSHRLMQDRWEWYLFSLVESIQIEIGLDLCGKWMKILPFPVISLKLQDFKVNWHNKISIKPEISKSIFTTLFNGNFCDWELKLIWKNGGKTILILNYWKILMSCHDLTVDLKFTFANPAEI